MEQGAGTLGEGTLWTCQSHPYGSARHQVCRQHQACVDHSALETIGETVCVHKTRENARIAKYGLQLGSVCALGEFCN